MSGAKRKSDELSKDENKNGILPRLKPAIETLDFILDEESNSTPLNASSKWDVYIWNENDPTHGVIWQVGIENTTDSIIHARVALRYHDMLLFVLKKTIFEPNYLGHHEEGRPGMQISENVAKKYGDNKSKLKVQVDIQYLQDASWTPTVPSHPGLTHLFKSSETTDTIIIVEGEEFKVHKCILEANCPILYDMVKNQTKEAAILLPGVDKWTFNIILQFIYGINALELFRDPCEEFLDSNWFERIYEPEWVEKVKSILCHANKFGIVKLKLWAEALLAYDMMEVDNAAELLMLADAHSCALLKEEAMIFIDFQAKAVLKSDGWSKLKKSSQLLSELFEFIHGSSGQQVVSVTDGYEGMSVISLLKKLDENNQELDGSREALILRCEEVKLAKPAFA